MKKERRKLETLLSVIVITVFLGQIYISPFNTDFRLSMAVIALSFLLVFFREVNVYICTSAVGVLMFLFRAGISSINNPGIDGSSLISMYMPVVVYYVSYGLLFNFMEIRDKSREPVSFTVSLWVIDTLPNIFELIVRQAWDVSPFDSMIVAAILIGGIRSLVTYQLIAMADLYTNRLESKQRDRQFKELLVFTARLKTELFFLRKSRQDIELAMKKCHDVYQRMKDPELKPEILAVAKEIHEIKKDYNRVISGMESTLGKEGFGPAMGIVEIFQLISDNSAAIAESLGKAVSIEIYTESHLYIERFYPLVSILNNLVINALEAIDDKGTIVLGQMKDEQGYRFSVRDFGPGISKEDLESIFVPGYSTKFNAETGKMSTGIGLTHARQLVEEVFESELKVQSISGSYTEFWFYVKELEEGVNE